MQAITQLHVIDTRTFIICHGGFGSTSIKLFIPRITVALKPSDKTKKSTSTPLNIYSDEMKFISQRMPSLSWLKMEKLMPAWPRVVSLPHARISRKKQPKVALSSTEPEYAAATMATQECVWLKQLTRYFVLKLITMSTFDAIIMRVQSAWLQIQCFTLSKNTSKFNIILSRRR